MHEILRSGIVRRSAVEGREFPSAEFLVGAFHLNNLKSIGKSF
jgi:hypothetical protein